ncbi:hypothetical protein NDA11_001634 [Ustilago hordei]|uniref:Uncharacterized protein n=1 Tax=Ustilago hordei TaxID=120017 RepID=I2FUG4_USTHO|nr:uncharacterized protein UHO2_04992 [Ustilago hordei]KAJ1043280.1 hypothetical protein NDA10_003027 [Ustilago hordei]KAJ1573053.1 hypothetical protein NDA12_004045 [Ustilago hordei]KAJ1577464.1 hypothetical protein NDA11_001634 [Ustilago hordei]KAJ1582230.1 hypothetical protein NDA15_006121 [Ustilago hordei]KAJ1597745.1 hypothetical protein NDA14_002919 [Ustilago hordei]
MDVVRCGCVVVDVRAGTERNTKAGWVTATALDVVAWEAKSEGMSCELVVVVDDVDLAWTRSKVPPSKEQAFEVNCGHESIRPAYATCVSAHTLSLALVCNSSGYEPTQLPLQKAPKPKFKTQAKQSSSIRPGVIRPVGHRPPQTAAKCHNYFSKRSSCSCS